MAQTYMARRRADNQRNAVPAQTAAPGPSLEELRGGAMPSQEQMGHKVDLPGAMREKMEASFGMDFSGVQLYESQTVADAGARAMAMGNKIGFAPGQLDLASSGGQAVLGHELSHIAAQARGEVFGSGFLNDHVLEARADREGAMAAAGESVYSGPVTPISTTSTALSAAGPMQAKKATAEEKEQQKYSNRVSKLVDWSGARAASYAKDPRASNPEEDAAYEKEMKQMIATPEDRERLTNELIKQRLAASRSALATRDEATQRTGSKGMGTVEALYSEGGRTLNNIQTMMYNFSDYSGGEEITSQMRSKVGEMSKSENEEDREAFNTMTEATDGIIMANWDKLAEGVPGGMDAMTARGDELEAASNERTIAKNPYRKKKPWQFWK